MSLNINEMVDRKTTESFPNIIVYEPNDTTPVVVNALEKGDMQLILTKDGKRKVVARISQSAYNIDKLLRTCSGLCYNISSGVSLPITDIATYLSYIT